VRVHLEAEARARSANTHQPVPAGSHSDAASVGALGWRAVLGRFRRAPRRRIAVVGHAAGAELYGAERSLLSLLEAIDRDRYDICCTLPADNEEYTRRVRRFTNDIAIFDYRWWHRARPSDPDAVARFAEFFERQNVALVHVNTITLTDPLIAARQLGLPCIVHVREIIDQDRFLAAAFDEEPSAIVARIKNAADFVIGNSDATLRLFGKGEDSCRLYNSVDSDAFDLANDPVPGRLRVGIISSNQPCKGIEQFVEIAALAARRRPGMEFVVVGPRNAYTDGFARAVREAPAPINLRFDGYVDDPVEAVGRVDVVVSLSLVAESFGRTLAEGMAARRPVIAYAAGAPPEFVRHGIDGFIVPRLDLMQVLDRLEWLMADPARIVRMGNAGRLRVRELFAPSLMSATLNRIYRRLLEQQASAAVRVSSSTPVLFTPKNGRLVNLTEKNISRPPVLPRQV
jgi:glycosyltransferase involved in cell wall biosynthesis